MRPIRQFGQVVKLALKNVWRWRWRTLTVAALVALAFSLYVLYGGLLMVSGQRGMASVEPLKLPADMIVVAAGESLGKTAAQFPRPKFNRAIMDYGEEAVALTTFSRMGEVEVMGIQGNSRFFPLSDMGLTGSTLTKPGDMVLPQAFAQARGLKVGDSLALSTIETATGTTRQGQFTVVGLFSPSYDLAEPLVRQEDLLTLKAKPTTNRFLIRKVSDCKLEFLVEWMATTFPDATLLSAETPQRLGEKIVREMYQPGRQVLGMIYLFMGIGVLSVTLITLLERRRELAVLKTLGVSNTQTASVMGSEQAVAGILGLGVGYGAVQWVGQRLSWFVTISPIALRGLIWQGVLLTLLVLFLSAFFPTLTAKVATVNQLLFARTIPIFTHKVDQLERPYPWLVEREQQEGIRLIRLEVIDGKFEGALLKGQGATVKKGEVVATQENFFGLSYKEWCSPVDGVISEYNDQSGYMAFKPFEAGPTVRYPTVQVEEPAQRKARVSGRTAEGTTGEGSRS